MDRARVAEWMLRRVVDRQRASEIVGDQLETRAGAPTVGESLRFWASIVWVCVVFSWRTPVATLLAAVAGILAWWPFAITGSRLHLSEQLHSPQVAAVAFLSLSISMLLWAEAVFSAVRFGVRDELTKLSLGASLLGSFAACCLWWLPHGAVILRVGVAALILFQMTSAGRRRALAIWLPVVLGTWFVARFLLTSAFANFHVGPRKLGLYTTLYLYVSVGSVPLLLAFTSVYLHRRLLGEAKSVVS